MKLVVPKELEPGEQRVAIVPAELSRLAGLGVETVVQSGAGALALYPDEDYEAAGAKLVSGGRELFEGADLVAKVQPPTVDEVDEFPEGISLLSFLAPSVHLELVRRLVAGKITAFSFELLPRISRAQAMDALSSQSTVAGYRAVLIAANKLTKFFPLLMTAAGTVPPARVLVLGTGVAGLQAIATARRLGALVSGYDVRPASREEVKSLGATFLELSLEASEGAGGYAAAQSEDFQARQQEMMATHVAGSDVIITTAAVPGGRAPTLVTAAMVDGMRAGSVIVDLAAASGGNCELTKDGQEVVYNGVYIVAAAELAASLPTHASSLYARNVSSFVRLLTKDGQLAPDFSDEILDKSAVTISGSVHHEPTRAQLEESPA
jgi:H+-translocating NAD(P) transhydrogenase subunit alpha